MVRTKRSRNYLFSKSFTFVLTTAITVIFGAIVFAALAFVKNPRNHLPKSVTNASLIQTKTAFSIPQPTLIKSARTLRVGPEQAYKTPAQAAEEARYNDLIEIEAGLYLEGSTEWHANNLTLRGIGGRAHMQVFPRIINKAKTNKNRENNKAIWLITGNNITIENMVFSGTRATSQNRSEIRFEGNNRAGISFEGRNLTLRNCYFHDNETGLITADDALSNIFIENSEFSHNSLDYRIYKQLGHNLFIGIAHNLVIRNSYIHHADIGHHIKTQAINNYILYNRIMDESGGSSYLIDFVGGGYAYLLGNLFQQGKNTENDSFLAFASEENREDPAQSLYVINNTFVNEYETGVFVNNHSVAPSTLINNVFIGPGTAIAGAGEQANNFKIGADELRNIERFDYRPRSDSAVIDQGIDPGFAENGMALRPVFEHAYPQQLAERPSNDSLDIGAYEFVQK